MTRVHIPATVEALKEGLGGIEALLTAKRWERAAIVFAWASPGQGGSDTNPPLSIKAFARLGFRGLTTPEDVREYRRAWESGGGSLGIKPGDDVTLPEATWKDHFGESTPDVQERVAKALMSDPEKAQRVMNDPKVRSTVAKAVAKDPEAKREFYHAVEEGLGSPKGRPATNQPTQDIIPSAVLRGIANDAISLADRLANLIDLIEQHPEVIPAIKALTNMGGGTPDYLSFALGTLSPAVEDAQKAIGPYLPANMAKVVTA